MKKFFAMMMALAMALALAVPALGASSTGKSDGTYNYGGHVIVPTVKVWVYNGETGYADTEVGVVFNPYSIEQKEGKQSWGGSTGVYVFSDAKNAQVLSTPRVIENKSNCKVAISVTAVNAKKAGKVNLVSKAPTKATTTLDAFLYLEGKNSGITEAKGAVTGAYNKDDAHVIFPDDQATTKIQTLFTLGVGDTTPTWGQIGIGGALQADHAADTDGSITSWSSADKVTLTYKLGIAPAV